MTPTQTILAFAISVAFLDLPANADGLTMQGLDDPEVTAPADPRGDWTGLYAGLSYARTSASTSTESCRKVFEGVDYGTYACNDPVFDYFLGSKVTDTTSTDNSSDRLGGFIGYRHSFDWRMVGGVELGKSGDLATIEAQAGLDAGRVLPYAFAGYGQMGGSGGTIYGIGADVKVGRRAFVGIKQTEGDFGGATTLRAGWRF